MKQKATEEVPEETMKFCDVVLGEMDNLFDGVNEGFDPAIFEMTQIFEGARRRAEVLLHLGIGAHLGPELRPGNRRARGPTDGVPPSRSGCQQAKVARLLEPH